MADKTLQRLDVQAQPDLVTRLLKGEQATPAGRPAIGPVPTSSILDRVRGFLPSLESANEDLARRMAEEPAQNFDIEARSARLWMA
ncbi:hypothetical protein WJX72_003631 [[Myrmecia] bisecta]|uniref:Uncharacterized protein n=1 Tax=[Myrmecia] bisecta TaxID=41462 RepID=A0AAW1PLH1_9CHLO